MNLLEEVWGEETAPVNEPLQVEIGNALLKLLEDRMILVEDVRRRLHTQKRAAKSWCCPATATSWPVGVRPA